MKKDDLAMIVYSNSGKAGVKPSAIKMSDSSSLPKKKAAVQNETTVVVEKRKKLPLFYEPKLNAREFDLF
jgi:hypothetical protein